MTFEIEKKSFSTVLLSFAGTLGFHSSFRFTSTVGKVKKKNQVAKNSPNDSSHTRFYFVAPQKNSQSPTEIHALSEKGWEDIW